MVLKSQNHVVNSYFYKNIGAHHHKGREVPIHRQPKDKVELEKLLKEGHVEKLLSWSDQNILPPIVNIVKRNNR